jgi:hypothetical protein
MTAVAEVAPAKTRSRLTAWMLGVAGVLAGLLFGYDSDRPTEAHA